MWNDESTRQTPFALTPWVRGLIVANAVVFLLTITVFRPTGAPLSSSWIFDFSAFTPSEVTRWWTFVTYMFVHGGFFHLAFNMLLLFFFGPPLEERMGGSAFALYYLTCGLGGAIFSFAVALITPVAPFVGASAAVLGVALAFAINWPDAPIYIFPLPVPIKVKWLVGFLVVTNILFVMANDGVARFAHLGGLLFGYIYLRGEEHVMRRARSAMTKPWRPRVLPYRAAQETASTDDEEPVKSDRLTRDDEVDRLLDKISKSGIDSLSPDERKVLQEASRQLRQH